MWAVSGLAAAVWAVRAWLYGPIMAFLFWNLALAWVPWLLGVWLTARPRPLPVVMVVGAAWLLFFPNAPYLVTDLAHFKPRPPAPLWMDVLLLTSFGWAGCALGWSSLARVHDALRARWGRWRAHAGLIAVLLLTGVGVFLGRVERWNSWDVVARPGALAQSLAFALGSAEALRFSLLFAAFVGAGYLWSRRSGRPLAQ